MSTYTCMCGITSITGSVDKEIPRVWEEGEKINGDSVSGTEKRGKKVWQALSG